MHTPCVSRYAEPMNSVIVFADNYLDDVQVRVSCGTSRKYHVKHLSPAYFALVMATGIISIAAWDFELFTVATAMFVFNLVAFAILACLTVLRALRYPRLFL